MENEMEAVGPRTSLRCASEAAAWRHLCHRSVPKLLNLSPVPWNVVKTK